MARARTRRGFTLMETVAAIVILSLAVPPMLWSVSQAQRQRVNPVLASKARWLAVQKLEDIIADRHSASGSRGYSYLQTANYPDENPGDITGYPGFARTVTFNETEADLVTAGSGYMTVTVTVTWSNADGASRSLAISTVITDYVPT